MPLTEKGTEVLKAMKEKYGNEKGEEVFYASKNSGNLTGVDSALESLPVTVSVKEVTQKCKDLWGPFPYTNNEKID